VTRVVFVLALVVAVFSVGGAFEITVLDAQEYETAAEEYEVSGTAVGGVGEPLPGVLVTLSGSDGKQSTVSGGDGAFSFASVASGTYSLVFKVKGKKKVKREITVTNSDVDLGKISLE
jgi:hypothetical protein